MLLKYLQQIQAGRPVNYQKLLALLPPGFYQQRSRLFKVKASGAGKWQVQVADPELFADLLQSAENPQSRLVASQQGDSHRAVTSNCFLLVFHQALTDARPEVVLAQAAVGGQVQLQQAYRAKPSLLLVENEENFFRCAEVLQLASQMLAQPFALTNCDVALAAGSKVGSALLADWFAQYQHVYCAFDFDAAGLEIFDHLVKRYGAKVQFVVAADLTPWLAGFRCTPKNSQQLQKALQLAEQHHLYGLQHALQQSRQFLEQEVLLSAENVPFATD